VRDGLEKKQNKKRKVMNEGKWVGWERTRKKHRLRESRRSSARETKKITDSTAKRAREHGKRSISRAKNTIKHSLQSISGARSQESPGAVRVEAKRK